jgi:hypothetical protein
MQTVAPALSEHCHSPSSGMRGWRCSQRVPVHANAGPGARPGAAGGRATTWGPAPSQHTRSVWTSAQSARCGSGARARHAASTTRNHGA